MWNDAGDATDRDRTGRDRRGRLVVISGPSGSGKSTLVRRLLARPDLRLTVSVSATTRQPAAGRGAGPRLSLPHARSSSRRPAANCSSPPWSTATTTARRPARSAGRWSRGSASSWSSTSRGASRSAEKVPDALLVFIQVPSLEVLEARLRARGTDRRGDHRAAAGHRPPRAGNGLAV